MVLEKIRKYLKLNNTHLSNPCVQEEITKEVENILN